MTDGDRATHRVDAGVVISDAVVVEQRQNLNGECFIELERTDVVDGQPGLCQRLLGCRNRPDAHDCWIHANKCVRH